MTLSPLFEGITSGEAQFYFEEFFNFVSEPAIVFDDSLHVISANNAFYETFEISREDSEGGKLFEHGDGEWGIAGLGQLLKKVASPGNAGESIEVRHRFKNGGERVLRLKARRIEDKGAKSCFIVLLIADVTDLRNLEEDSSYLKAILEYIPEGILITDVNHVVRKVSNFMGEILNVPAENLLHLDEPGRLRLLDWYWPDGEQITRPDYLPLSKSAIKGQIYQDCEILVKHDGKTKVLSANAAPIRDKKGAIIGAIGAWRDITAIKKTELDLRKSEEKYAKAFNSSPVALALTSLEDGTLAEVNEAFSSLTGYSRDELIGRTSVELGITTPAIRQKSKEQTSLKGKVYLEETKIRNRSGQMRDIIFSAEVLELQGKQFFLSTSMDITERKHTEEELRRAHSLLQSVTQGTEDMIAAEDLDFRYTYFNEAYFREFRKLWKEEIRVGTSMLEAMAPWPEERQKAHDLWKRALQGESFNITLEFGPIEKERRFYDLRFNPLRDEQGRVIGAAHFLRNITDEVRTRNALRESEERMRFTLEATNIGIWDLDLEDKTAYHSPEHDRIFGYDRPLDEWTWADFLSHVLPEYHEQTIKMLEESTAGKTQWTNDCQIRRADGEIRWIWFTGKHKIDLRGHGRMFGVVMDITERKKTEQELNRARELNEALNRINIQVHSELEIHEVLQKLISESATVLGSQTAAISIRHGEGWVVRNVYGMSEEIIGKYMNDEQEQHALLACQSQQPVAVEDAFNDVRFNHGNFSHYNIHAVLVVPLIAQGNSFGVLFFNFHDGPHRFKQIELDFARKLASATAIAIDNANLFQELRKSNKELTSANKELESFSYSVSHDLRAPLRAISGFSTILQENYSDKLDEDGKDILNRITDSTNRMALIIADMLSLAKITRESMNWQEIDLSSIANSIVNDLRQSEPGRNIEINIPQSMPAIADTRLMSIALANLIENAWKYSGKNPRARIDIGMMNTEGSNVFFVRDNGSGFDMNLAHKLFQPFHRLHADSQFPGTGIGLAITKKVIQRHDGRIWAETEIGKGSTFYFTLASTHGDRR